MKRKTESAEDERLVHLIHIPSAAGDTITTILGRQNGNEVVYSTAWGNRGHTSADRAARTFVGWCMGPSSGVVVRS